MPRQQFTLRRSHVTQTNGMIFVPKKSTLVLSEAEEIFICHGAVRCLMDVYLLRHGKAEDRSANISSDARRPLTESGILEMHEISRGIVRLGICPDHIISSRLARARETAQIVSDAVAESCDYAPKRAMWGDLAPESDISKTHKLLAAMAKPDKSIMLVGHQPHLSLFTSSILVSRRDPYLHTRTSDKRANTNDENATILSMTLKKGGLVAMRCAVSGSAVYGSLRSLLTPKQLRMCGSRRR